MDELLRHVVNGRTAVVGATVQVDGDMHPERVAHADLADRQRSLVGSRWTMLEQVHADAVHVESTRGARWPLAGTGDVLVAPSSNGDPIAVWAADCAPIALVTEDGTRAVVHAGWRGLAAGVIDAAVECVTRAGAVGAAVLGPCIHPCCYEFSDRDLEAVAQGAGVDPDSVSDRTAWGAAALDVPATIRAVLARHGISLDAVGPCTGCDQRFYSHRRRRDVGRHALVVWWEDGT